MAISMKELLMGRATLTELDSVIQENLCVLLVKINIVRTAYGKPMKVNDGFRRPKDTPKNGAVKSKHLLGQAVDIDDNDAADFWYWCLDNLHIIHDAGLYMEDPRWTHGSVGTWLHFQSTAPASKKFIFVPSTAPASTPALWNGIYDKKYDVKK